MPNQINISKLSAAIGSSRSTTYAYLHYLEQANILRSVWGKGRNASMLSKPEKLYLANTNNAWALCPAPPVGTLRETFFCKPARPCARAALPGRGWGLHRRRPLVVRDRRAGKDGPADRGARRRVSGIG